MKQVGWAWILLGAGVVNVYVAFRLGIMRAMPFIGTEMIMAGALLLIYEDFK